jgi:hypothetical protein
MESTNTSALNMQNTFSVEDLKRAAGLIRSQFYGIPIKEREMTTNEERVEKYQALKDLSDFIKTFGEAQQEAAGSQTLRNKIILDKLARKVRDERQLPLEYSSDEDFMYMENLPASLANSNSAAMNDLDLYA